MISFPRVTFLASYTTVKSILLFGSGRWARVYIRILREQYPSCCILVYTTSQWRSPLQKWIHTNDFTRSVAIISDLNSIAFSAVLFAIVVNKASSHYSSALFCLSHNCHVAIEKPICLSSIEYNRLLDLANSKGLVLLPLLVFAFHPSVHHLFSLFSPTVSTDFRLDFTWCDQASDNRHGGFQTFDSSIPSYFDVLPHILSVISLLGHNRQPKSLAINKFSLDSSSFDLSLSGAYISSRVTVRRGYNVSRLRLIQVSADALNASLDFTVEPGFVISRSCTESQYIKCLSWDDTHSPLKRQLQYFSSLISGSKDSLCLSLLHNSVANFFSLLSGL